MENKISFAHFNIVAEDWKKLASFYMNVFDCKMTYPERDLSGEWINTLTGIDNVRIRGAHLTLPGCDGITIEIFEYEPPQTEKILKAINRKGLAHIAFHVDDVAQILDILKKNGGISLSEIVKKDYPGIGILTVVYVRDIEGNFIELQNWKK